MNNIISGDFTFAPFSAPTSNGDAAIWRVEDSLLAPMYRPTIRLTGKSNAKQTNSNMTLKVNFPVVRTVDGVQVSTNTVVATGTLTALQNVTTNEVINAIEALIAGLSEAKVAMAAGKTIV